MKLKISIRALFSVANYPILIREVPVLFVTSSWTVQDEVTNQHGPYFSNLNVLLYWDLNKSKFSHMEVLKIVK